MWCLCGSKFLDLNTINCRVAHVTLKNVLLLDLDWTCGCPELFSMVLIEFPWHEGQKNALSLLEGL